MNVDESLMESFSSKRELFGRTEVERNRMLISPGTRL